MIKKSQIFPMMALGVVAACAAIPIEGDPAVEVAALAETVPVGTEKEDAADDPAIWFNAQNPEQSLIIGTDKKAGLHVYSLDGAQRSFLAAGNVNNVDLIELANGTILVAASDRTDPVTAHILLAELDPKTAILTELGRVNVGAGEAYGFCIGVEANDGAVRFYSPLKDGSVYQTTVRQTSGKWRGANQLLVKLDSQPEGCVFHQSSETLFVGEETRGIWRLAKGSKEPELVAKVDNHMLVADVEGLAIAQSDNAQEFLVASSQGDNAYAVYSLPEIEPVGRFRIAAGQFGATEETDGIAIDSRNFGDRYPGGIFVAQDGINAPSAQNFKIASWRDIEGALIAPKGP